MGPISRFEDLEVWQLARELAKVVYKLVRKPEFARDIRFVGQITASAGSVMDNIAEGFGRGGNKELINFLFYARGSNSELQSQLYRASDCGYITQEEFEQTMMQAKTNATKITNFIIYLKKSDQKGEKYNN